MLSCRSFMDLFKLNKIGNPKVKNLYMQFYKYHSIYWMIFWLFLILHLMVTITHVGLPMDPYIQAHRIVFITSIINLILVFLIFLSCRTFRGLFRFLPSDKAVENKVFKRFFKLHSYFWLLLIVSFGFHIIFGMIHAINTWISVSGSRP